MSADYVSFDKAARLLGEKYPEFAMSRNTVMKFCAGARLTRRKAAIGVVRKFRYVVSFSELVAELKRVNKF